jgi:hypothetical protein
MAWGEETPSEPEYTGDDDEEEDEDEDEGGIISSPCSPPLKSSPRLVTSSANRRGSPWCLTDETSLDGRRGRVQPTAAARCHLGMLCPKRVSALME